MVGNRLLIWTGVIGVIAIAAAITITVFDRGFPLQPSEVGSGGDSSGIRERPVVNREPQRTRFETDTFVALQSRRRQDEFQPIERELLATGSLSYQSLKAEMDDEDTFNAVLDALHEQYYGDVDAGEITKLYREEIAGGLASADADVTLTRLQCGLSVCGASLHGSHLPEVRFTEMLMESGDRAGIYSSVIVVVPPEIEGVPASYRVFFSTDPRASEIRVRP